MLLVWTFHFLSQGWMSHEGDFYCGNVGATVRDDLPCELFLAWKILFPLYLGQASLNAAISSLSKMWDN